MHTGKLLLTSTWIAAITAVVGLGATFEQASQQFFGITDNREHVISFPHPVEIVEAYRVEGEQVSHGTILLTLSRPDLNAEAQVLEHQITEIEARHKETTITLQGEIAQVRQDFKVRSAELDTTIGELEERHRIDLAMVRSISGRQASDSTDGVSPLQAKLAGLRYERRQVSAAATSRIQSLQQRLDASVAPEQAQLAELRTQLDEIERQQARLNVIADKPGRIGSVLYRPGDTVPAFASIITLHGAAPELVKGYIHEDVISEIEVGRRVWLRSMAATERVLTGTVESLGARIVAYPDRLLKNSSVPAWGREVVVRLDDGGQLLLGERVVITLQRPKSVKEQIATLIDSSMQMLLGVREVAACCGCSGTPEGADCQEISSR